MSSFFFPTLFALILLAIFVQDGYIFTLVYLFIGLFLLGRWWSAQSIQRVTFQRTYPERVFPGEDVKVILKVTNTGWLPILWLQLTEALPVELVGGFTFRQVLALRGHASQEFEYMLYPQRRGYYAIGPLQVTTGDLAGLSKFDQVGEPTYLTVFPRVIPLVTVPLQSRIPYGTIRHHQPLFEDPSRSMGKRPYTLGDPPKLIDWKSTASTGSLFVKKFEPSISLDTAIFLDFSKNSYYYKRRIDSTEMGVVIAASVASWVISRRQQVGFYTNGEDAILPDHAKTPGIPSGKGSAHLARLLEALARVEMTDADDFCEIFRRERVRLAWGTTVMVITAIVSDALFEELFLAVKSGLNISLVLCGPVIGEATIKARAQAYGVQVIQFFSEKDIENWRH